jgi:hypothetical protein
MSSPEMLLRSRYSLSFFITTLLIALTTDSSLAFSITPPTDYLPVAPYIIPPELYVTTLNPLAVTNITRGGTTGFLQTLNQAFQNWTFNPAPNDLAGTFYINKYRARNERDSIPLVGGEIELFYIPGDGDPILDDSLRWIQRVVNNHSFSPNVHGNNADIIDNVTQDNPYPTTPYYPYNTNLLGDNTDLLGYRSFYDFSTRPDQTQNHNWLAELYLVKKTAPQQVTIYNGIQWGWNNTNITNVQSVPEPLTIFASGVCLGFGALFKKIVKVTGQNKTKSLEKLKN